MKKSTIKHLEMIEKVIERLAGNSFKYKGWCITLISALLALAAKESFAAYAVVGLVPAVCFWALDAYYLSLERAFRDLYASVATTKAASGADFNMDIAGRQPCWLRVAFSPSVAGLYIPLVLSVVLGAVMIHCSGHPDHGSVPNAVTP